MHTQLRNDHPWCLSQILHVKEKFHFLEVEPRQKKKTVQTNKNLVIHFYVHGILTNFQAAHLISPVIISPLLISTLLILGHLNYLRETE